MSHYYTNDPNLASEVKMIDVQIFGTSFRFYTDRGVFSREGLDFGTNVLLKSIQIPKGIQSVVDMGCGYGPIGISISKTHPNLIVYMIDVNVRAVDLAKRNATLNHTENVRISEGFLFGKIDDTVDLIISNPPIRAGKKVVFQLYDEAHQKLTKDGYLYVVIQKKQGAPSTLEKLKTLFHQVEIIARDKGYWVIRAQK